MLLFSSSKNIMNTSKGTETFSTWLFCIIRAGDLEIDPFLPNVLAYLKICLLPSWLFTSFSFFFMHSLMLEGWLYLSNRYISFRSTILHKIAYNSDNNLVTSNFWWKETIWKRQAVINCVRVCSVTSANFH